MTTTEPTLIFVNRTSTDANRSATETKPRRRNHTCEVCNKPFKRSEHLLRHERAHRQEKPFKCRYCPKGFARKDLLSRHEKTLHALVYEELDNASRRRTRNTEPHLLRAASQDSFPTPEDSQATTTSTNFGNNVEMQRLNDRTIDHSEGLLSILSGDSIVMSSANNLSSRIARPFSHSGSDLHNPTPDQQSLLQENQIFPSSFEAISSSKHGDAASEQLVLGPNQINGTQQATSMGSPTFVPDRHSQADSFGMQMELDSTGFFSMIDETIFSHVSFPMDLMDFDASPQSFDLDCGISDSKIGMNVGGTFQRHQAAKESAIIEPFSKPATRQRRFSQRPSDPKHITVTESIRARLLEDLRQNYGTNDEQLRCLPSARSLDNFLWKFFQCFQRHLPIFHVPTFDLLTTPAPLRLAMCSIGALYSLNRRHAAALRLIANDAMKAIRPKQYTGQPALLEPVWQTQCKLLITFGAMFGSNPGDASDGMSELGCFVKPFALRREMLSTQTSADHFTTWADWIEYELAKRLLCGIFIASSLNAATYDLSPGFSSFRDLNFEIPADESFWDAQTSEEWQLLVDDQRPKKPQVVIGVITQLVSGDEARLPSPSCSDIGAFAATVVMHGVNVHMYHLAHSMSILATLNKNAHIEHALKARHQKQTERALSRCQEFLKAWQLAHDDSLQNRHEESCIFNCQALLRLSYVRVFSGLVSFGHSMLLCEGTADIATAAGKYVNIYQSRNGFLTKAAEQVMFCFTAPVRAGHMLTRKTAAFTWSIEHAVASWECTLFLSKWIHTVEIQESDLPLSQEENNIFEVLKETLQEAESPYDDQVSLAAQVIRIWATFMDDVWVWEVTLRMGTILRQLANVYDQSWQLRRMHDCPPGNM